MDIVIAEFNQRVAEVESYFSFSANALKNKATLSFKKQDQQKIQKANSFILLYNLVESSFKSTLQKLCDDINNSQASYKNTIPAIRKIWLQYEKRNYCLYKIYFRHL